MRCELGILATSMAALLGCAEIDSAAPIGDDSDSQTQGGSSDESTESDRNTETDERETDSQSDIPTDGPTDSGNAEDTETSQDTLDDVDTDTGTSGRVECTEENAEAVCGDAELCADGICCDRPCHGACEACNLPGSKGTCSFLSLETLCRDAAHSCDVAENCTGLDSECPADGAKPKGELCRPSSGECDIPETCAGDGSSCPEDVFEASDVICRQPADICDKGEYCSGNAPGCPEDILAGTNTICRPKAGLCDVGPEYCSGSSTVCPPDSLHGSGVPCRASAGACDEVEYCGGSSPYCPVDAYKSPGLLCRPGTGGCDTPEFCSGFSPTCPADAPGTVTYFETFDSPELPEGWEIIDGDGEGFDADGATWEYAVDSPPAGGEGGYWIANSDECQCRMADSLKTGWYDLTDCSSVKIEFEHVYSYYIFGYIPDDGYVLITYDDTDWFIWEQYSNNSSGLQSETRTIGASEQEFRLKFLYDSLYNFWWKIDNVKVTGTP